MKFRKKSEHIEAIQFNGVVDGVAQWSEAPKWLVKATQTKPGGINTLQVDVTTGRGRLFTGAGPVEFHNTDWIVKHDHGYLWAYSDHLFNSNYEPV